jgi:hypothetical protein
MEAFGGKTNLVRMQNKFKLISKLQSIGADLTCGVIYGSTLFR